MARVGAAVLATLVWAGGAGGAEFVLRSGETLEGEILQASRNGVVIRPRVGGPRQLARSEIETVRLATARGAVEGELLAWADGVYEIAAGARALQVRDGRILAEVARAEPGEPAPPDVAAVDPGAAVAPAPAAGPAETAPEPVPDTSTAVATAAPGTAPAAPPGALPVLSAVPVAIADTAAVARFDLKLSEPAAQPVVVIYSTLDGTAKAGIDFEKQQGVLTLLPGETRKQLEVPLLDGSASGDARDFTLYLVVDRDVAELEEPRVTGTIPPAR